eukprot:augustus_masked-scaffold_14-processed-gene-9.44-mRNA-1 protein AED:1.00 eAED:1.00 QI:0/-1/0/0/-1/1/1/0/830
MSFQTHIKEIISLQGRRILGIHFSRDLTFRCFPGCKSVGHSSRQFCGTELSVKVSLENKLAVTPQELFFFGEFIQFEVNSNTIVREKLNLREGLFIDEIASFILSDKKDHQGVFVGTLSEKVLQGPKSATFTVDFNKGKGAWPYSWTGTKNSALIQHAFRSVIYYKDNSRLRILCEKCSPKFTIYSRRKAKTSKLQHETVRRAELEPEVRKYQSFYRSPRVIEMIDIDFVKDFHANYTQLRVEALLFLRFFQYAIHYSQYVATFASETDTESVISFSKGLLGGFEPEQFISFTDNFGFGPLEFTNPEAKQQEQSINLRALISKLQTEKKSLAQMSENDVDLLSELEILEELGSDLFNFFVFQPEIDQSWREIGLFWGENGRLFTASLLSSFHFKQMDNDLSVELFVLDFYLMSRIAIFPREKLHEYHTCLDLAMPMFILLFKIAHLDDVVPSKRKNARKLLQTQNILELLAFQKLLPFDPDSPPATYSFAFMLTQLKQRNNYSLEHFSSVNLSYFQDDQLDKKIWSRSISCFYRNLYQELIILSAHILKQKNQAAVKQLHSIPSGYNIEGKEHLEGQWDRMIALSDEEVEGGYLIFLNKLWGLKLGSGFHLMCEDNILKNMHISFSGPLVSINFNEFMFFRLNFEFFIDGQIHDTDILDLPFSPKLRNKKYVGWIENHCTEDTTLRFVIAATLDEFLGGSQTGFTDRLKEFFITECSNESEASIELPGYRKGLVLRIAFQLKFTGNTLDTKITLVFFEGEDVSSSGDITNKKQRLSVSQKSYQARNVNLAPNLGNLARLNLLFDDEEELKQFGVDSVTRRHTYYKCQIDS